MNSSSFDLAEEVPYTYSYCDELNPLRAALPLLANGFEPPAIRHACELGFGQGVSINLHAAGAPVQWHGVDANPEHVEFAQQLAQRAQIPLQLSSQRFGEYCRRGDLPDFDFIGLYVSYNTLPGWAAMLPLRDLMHAHLQAGDATGSAPLSRIGDAAAFAQQVMNAQAGYALVNPSLRERVHGLAGEDPRYLAHEYFSRNWKPTSFSEVAAALDAADLVYAGSADYRDHVDSINLTSAQRTLLAGIGDVALRETTRDLCVNRSLRRDYWIRQPRMLDTDAKHAALRAQRVILALPEAKVALKVRGALGETALPEAQYRPILRALANGRPTTLGEIERSVRPFGIPLLQIVTAIKLLIATGQVFNAQPDERIRDAQAGAARMNAALCEHAHDSGAVPFLVSPVTGAGVAVPHVAQLFMLARMRGNTEPAQWATFAAAAQPHLSSAQLLDKATQFADVYWPVLRTLGIDTGIAA